MKKFLAMLAVVSVSMAAFAGDAPASLEELRDRSGLETGALLARLTELELRDAVRRLPGPLFVRHH